MPVSDSLRRLVLERDGHRCVYCHTTPENSGQRLQIDHILPVADGGPTTLENLCACCASCNNHKWTKTQAADPETGRPTPLFHPLRQQWREHFTWDDSGTILVGRTPCGRATIDALQMNNAVILLARRRWVEAGWHPPR